MSSFWRAWVRTEADRLEEELGFITGVEGSVSDAITDAIQTARAAAGGRSTPAAWWTGSDIETAWRSLHRGQEHLLLVAPEPRVQALVPEIAAAVDVNLSKRDRRRNKYLTALDDFVGKDGVSALEREQLRAMWRAAHGASDVQYANLRAFRNLLLLVTLLLVAAVAGVTVLHDRAPGTLPLCAAAEETTTTTTTVPATTTSTTAGKPKVQPRLPNCPTGEKKEATTSDAVAVELVGALGALLAAAAALSRPRRFQAPYGVPFAQVVLKVAAGSATALFGVVVIQNEVLGITSPESGRAILAYAALFGYAQQAVTRWVDSQARDLLGAATTTSDPARTKPADKDDVGDDAT